VNASTVESVILATKVVLPVLRDVGTLFTNLLDGTRSLLTGRADLRNILITGLDRLDAAEADDRKRDAEESARVAKLDGSKK
jgi:hypothetical protein